MGTHLICIAHFCHKAPSISLSYHMWKHSAIVMFLAQYLIAIWAAGEASIENCIPGHTRDSQALGLETVFR